MRYQAVTILFYSNVTADDYNIDIVGFPKHQYYGNTRFISTKSSHKQLCPHKTTLTNESMGGVVLVT